MGVKMGQGRIVRISFYVLFALCVFQLHDVIVGSRSSSTKTQSKVLPFSDEDDDTTKLEKEMEEKESSFSVPPSIFFILLSIQCGCQPLLVKLFMPTTIVRSTAVFGQEGVKLIVSIFYLVSSNNWRDAVGEWTFKAAFTAAGVPGLLYVIQNYCNVMANQTLPPVTFSVLNQTKMLSTAWCCFLLMGQKQSYLQVVALILLVFSALIIQKIVPLQCPKKSNQAIDDAEKKKFVDDIKQEEEEKAEAVVDEENPDDKVEVDLEDPDDVNGAGYQLQFGVLPALAASFLSGLAGTLAQKTLQVSGRSPHLFNSELACFSSSYLVVSLLLGSPDGKKIWNGGITQGWNWKTWIPIVSNGLGAILVGLVTKYQGAVVKGFAMIFGMAISGVLQQTVLASSGEGVTREQIAGAFLGAFSLWLHMSHPPSGD